MHVQISVMKTFCSKAVFNCVISVRSGSHVSSSASVKSDRSKEGVPPDFSEKTSPSKRYFMCFSFYHCISKFLKYGACI